MKKAILATKVGMTQIFNEDGQLIPVTVLQAGPCVVTQVKTEENDGYAAVQVGYGEIREKLVNKVISPKDGEVKPGGTLAFSCTMTGKQAAIDQGVNWVVTRKDGSALASGTGIGGYECRSEYIQSDGHAEYNCKAYQKAGRDF